MIKRFKISIFTLALLFVFIKTLISQEHQYYFYHPEYEYGSELSFSPFTTLLNGGYDVLRNGSHENNGGTISVFQLDYKQGFHNVWNNISNPFYHIRKYGSKRFVETELIPASLNPDEAQWVPNYIHHIFGSGMLYVRMAEWYDYHNYKLPYVYSIITTLSYQFLNEAIENNHSKITNVDPIADILIFNPLGILLFSFSGIKSFFSQKVCLYDWSLQPVFNPANSYLENAGLEFAIKYRPSSWEKYSLFCQFGIDGLFGLSYSLDKEKNISMGIGTIVNRLQENIVNDSRLITPTTDGALGLFYDRNNSLLTSVVITGPHMYNARINIYPGLFSIGRIKPGFYLAFGEWDHFLIGITAARIPIGLLSGIN